MWPALLHGAHSLQGGNRGGGEERNTVIDLGDVKEEDLHLYLCIPIWRIPRIRRDRRRTWSLRPRRDSRTGRCRRRSPRRGIPSGRSRSDRNRCRNRGSNSQSETDRKRLLSPLFFQFPTGLLIIFYTLMTCSITCFQAEFVMLVTFRVPSGFGLRRTSKTHLALVALPPDHPGMAVALPRGVDALGSFGTFRVAIALWQEMESPPFLHYKS